MINVWQYAGNIINTCYMVPWCTIPFSQECRTPTSGFASQIVSWFSEWRIWLKSISLSDVKGNTYTHRGDIANNLHAVNSQCKKKRKKIQVQ